MAEGGSIFGLHADERHIPDIATLILEHGPNDWNYLPEDAIRQHVEGIATGSTLAIVAESVRGDNQLFGVVTYEIGHRFPQYQPTGRETEAHGYISEAVVHRDHVGKGLGSKMLGAAIKGLVETGIQEIYALRHAENEASAGMMRKNGMLVVDVFYDPEIRPNGSRQTVVTQRIVPPKGEVTG